MILDIVLAPILWIFDWFIGLFPSLEIPQHLITGLSDLFNSIATLNRYIPVNEIFACIVIIFIVSNATSILYIINWLLNKILELIPFIG